MKKFYLLVLFSLISLISFSQLKSVNQFDIVKFYYGDFDDPDTFEKSPRPFVTGYGEYSDTLKSIYGVDFYEMEGEYIPIRSWADYYYWYINTYFWLYTEPGLYQFYYLAGNNQEMVKYIFSDKYKLNKFPAAMYSYTDMLEESEINKRINERMEIMNSKQDVDEFVADLEGEKEEADYSKNPNALKGEKVTFTINDSREINIIKEKNENWNRKGMKNNGTGSAGEFGGASGGEKTSPAKTEKK